MTCSKTVMYCHIFIFNSIIACITTDEFIDHSDKRIIELEHKIGHVRSDVLEMRTWFGEDLASAGTDCICVTFFTTFCDFMKKLKSAHKQNTEWKELVSHLWIHNSDICCIAFDDDYIISIYHYD